jgi:hypothetical protein
MNNGKMSKEQGAKSKGRPVISAFCFFALFSLLFALY